MPIAIQSFEGTFKPTRSWLRDWCLLLRRQKRQRLHLVNFCVFFLSILLKKGVGGRYERFLVINREDKDYSNRVFLFFPVPFAQ